MPEECKRRIINTEERHEDAEICKEGENTGKSIEPKPERDGALADIVPDTVVLNPPQDSEQEVVAMEGATDEPDSDDKACAEMQPPLPIPHSLPSSSGLSPITFSIMETDVNHNLSQFHGHSQLTPPSVTTLSTEINGDNTSAINTGFNFPDGFNGTHVQGSSAYILIHPNST